METLFELGGWRRQSFGRARNELFVCQALDMKIWWLLKDARWKYTIPAKLALGLCFPISIKRCLKLQLKSLLLNEDNLNVFVDRLYLQGS